MQPIHADRRANLIAWAVEPHENEAIRQAFEHLRYQVFVEEEGFERSNPLYPFRERTLEDDHSAYILVMQGNELLCGCRLIDGEQVRPLPVEEGMTSSVRSRAFEISRVCSLPTMRDLTQRCRVLKLLYQGIYGYAFDLREYDFLYSHIRTRYLKMLQRIFGEYVFTALGEPKEYSKNGKSVELIPVLGDPDNLGETSNPFVPMLPEYAEEPQVGLVPAWQTPGQEQGRLLLVA